MAANGVFCLEGEWDEDLRDRSSVLPMLQMLEQLRYLKFIHRDVATHEELAYYLGKWSQARYRDYRVLNLASHGDTSLLYWSGRGETTLSELADLLGDSAQGRYIHLGGCRTLFDDRQARSFVDRTGVAALTGFRKDVDWLAGAAFEMILLPSLAAHPGRPATLYKQLMTKHRDLARMYKFTMVTDRDVLRSQAPRA